VVEHFRIPFVIGAGSGGCKIASGITVPGIAKVAINSSWKDLDLLPDDVVKVRAGGGKGSGMDPKMGEKHYKAARDEVRRTLMDVVERCGYAPGDVSMIPVIVSTGFGFGSGSGSWIVRDLKKWFPKAVVLAFATTPFPFEGEETLRRSYESCRRMAEEVGGHINGQRLRRLPSRRRGISLAGPGQGEQIRLDDNKHVPEDSLHQEHTRGDR
jgi:cell division GTPase FtsZ